MGQASVANNLEEAIVSGYAHKQPAGFFTRLLSAELWLAIGHDSKPILLKSRDGSRIAPVFTSQAALREGLKRLKTHGTGVNGDGSAIFHMLARQNLGVDINLLTKTPLQLGPQSVRKFIQANGHLANASKKVKFALPTAIPHLTINAIIEFLRQDPRHKLALFGVALVPAQEPTFIIALHGDPERASDEDPSVRALGELVNGVRDAAANLPFSISCFPKDQLKQLSKALILITCDGAVFPGE